MKITREMWQAAKAGDPKVIEQLVDKYYRLAYRTTLKWVHKGFVPYDDAISIAHCVLMKCIRGNYDPDRAEFTTYLCRAVDNEVRMYLRQVRKVQKEISLETPVAEKGGVCVTLGELIGDPNPTVEELVTDDFVLREVEKAVMLALVKMKDNERLCFALWLQGMTHTKVAEVVGVSQSYASRLIGSAVKKVRKEAQKLEVC